METTKHEGACHCGRVRFTVELDRSLPAGRCNCSVCTKTSVTAMLVKPAAFMLREGESDLGVYEWGAKISKRYFCKHCGVHCFGRGYLEEVGGDYVSVNLHCIDAIDPGTLTIQYWDGRHENWEKGPRATPWPIFASA
jgi:hypothetical protein